MKKMIAIVLAGALLLMGIVLAHGNRYLADHEPGEYHESMESIMEEGSYQDLVDYREDVGFDIIPWVTDEDTFAQAQERHEQMEQWHEENGWGMHGMRGFGRQGGCPMMS